MKLKIEIYAGWVKHRAMQMEHGSFEQQVVAYFELKRFFATGRILEVTSYYEDTPRTPGKAHELFMKRLPRMLKSF